MIDEEKNYKILFESVDDQLETLLDERQTIHKNVNNVLCYGNNSDYERVLYHVLYIITKNKYSNCRELELID